MDETKDDGSQNEAPIDGGSEIGAPSAAVGSEERLGSQLDDEDEVDPGGQSENNDGDSTVDVEEVEGVRDEGAIVSGGAPGDAVEDGEASQGGSALGSMEDETGNGGGGGGNSTAAAASAAPPKFSYQSGRFVGAEGAEELRVQTKQIPPQFDPTKYSPIFFGY